jgi:hypothetical protein
LFAHFEREVTSERISDKNSARRKPPIMDCTLFEGPAEITKEVAVFSDA